MFANTFLLAMLAASVLAAPVLDIEMEERADKPDPNLVYIESISYGGSGCPQNSVGKFISEDRETFTLIFDAYQAQLGPNTQPTQARSNCQINLNLRYPQGWQFSVLDTIYRGYAKLDTGISGSQKATYYFSGQAAQVSTEAKFKGPYSDDYKVESKVGFTSLIWSPCGASLPLNINSQVRLTNDDVKKYPTATGLLTDDTIDGHFTQISAIQWRKCTT